MLIGLASLPFTWWERGDSRSFSWLPLLYSSCPLLSGLCPWSHPRPVITTKLSPSIVSVLGIHVLNYHLFSQLTLPQWPSNLVVSYKSLIPLRLHCLWALLSPLLTQLKFQGQWFWPHDRQLAWPFLLLSLSFCKTLVKSASPQGDMENTHHLAHCSYLKVMATGFKLAVSCCQMIVLFSLFLSFSPFPKNLLHSFIPLSAWIQHLLSHSHLLCVLLGKWKEWEENFHVLPTSHCFFYLYSKPCMWPVLLLLMMNCLCSCLRTTLPPVP